MKIILIYLVLAFISGQVKSCGISTHTEIIHRAFEFYDNPAFGPGEVRRIIQEQQGAFMAGAPFPDAFYNSLCKEGQFHYVSEDHHWGEYQKVAWDYFRRTYPDPIGNEKAERLLAFLLGMTSHQVADVLWHNLQDIKDGLIEMLAETTFDGDRLNWCRLAAPAATSRRARPAALPRMAGSLRVAAAAAVAALLFSWRAAGQVEEAAACSACTADGGSWQAGTCWTKELSMEPCAVSDAGGVCCRTPECCATAGCRSPGQSWNISGWLPPVSCSMCCWSSAAGCMYKEWVGSHFEERPWYNARGFARGRTCEEAFGGTGCPPCAQCDARTEEELLHQMRPAACVCFRPLSQPDPCRVRGSCDCFCRRVELGLAQCPQLRSRVVPPEASASTTTTTNTAATAAMVRTSTTSSAGMLLP